MNLQWNDEMGEMICNPVANKDGVRYEVYNNRVGKAYAEIRKGKHDLIIPCQNREQAILICETIAAIFSI